MKFYERLFAAFCYHGKKTFSKSEEADPWGPCVTLSVSTTLYLVALSNLIAYEYGGPNSFKIGGTNWVYVLGGVIFGLFYHNFVRNRMYEGALKEFAKISSRQRNIWIVVCWSYIGCSILVTMATFGW